MVLPVNEIDNTTIGAIPRTTRKISTAVEWASGANFDLFLITGGPILVRYLYGVVDTTFGVGAAVPQLRFTSTDGAVATVMAVAMATIAADTDGMIYTWTGAVGGTPVDAAQLGAADPSEYLWQLLGNFLIMVPGTIDIVNAVAGADGVVSWYLTWIPLRRESTVTAQ